MANYLTTDTELTSIANAIRTKGGTNAQLTFPTGFVTAINNISTGGSGGSAEVEITGNLSYFFQYTSQLLNNPNITFKTRDVTGVTYMFASVRGIDSVPFAINFRDGQGNTDFSYMFMDCDLKTIPAFNYGDGYSPAFPYNLSYMFYSYNSDNKITTISDFLDGANLDTLHSTSGGRFTNMFYGCPYLKSIDSNLLGKLWSNQTLSSSRPQYAGIFKNCYRLVKIENFNCFAGSPATTTYNMFNSESFSTLRCLKKLTFGSNGAACSLTNQTIQLTGGIGYSNVDLGSEFADDEYGIGVENSVYNHDSAVETINSLPDCSAVSSPSAPTNKIIFKAGSGANTAGGSISDLTAAEIAVATNRGWQVVIQ